MINLNSKVLSKVSCLRQVNKTTINDDETASSTMVYTICVIYMITVTAGCCLVTKTAVAMVALLLFFVFN
jgi:hypothetical protein